MATQYPRQWSPKTKMICWSFSLSSEGDRKIWISLRRRGEFVEFEEE